MRHPFDGIMIPDSQPTTVGASRRSALRWFAGTVASLIAVLGGQRRSGANPPQPQGPQPEQELDPVVKREKGYGLFFVVPRDFRRFDTARRKELGVNGVFANGWKGRPELAETRGFTTWMAPAEAERLRTAGDVAGVHDLKAEDKVIVSKMPGEPAELVVTLSPNAWRVKPDRSTYLTGKEVAALWAKKFAESGNVVVSPGRIDRNVEVRSRQGSLPDEVVAAIKADPQVSHLVYGLTYRTVPTEGAGDPLVPTTRNLGEEGGATTKAIGEEGGRPTTMTTFAVGEEGGATTRAVGEEGGRPPTVTTYAVGEEGGPRPAGATTKAIGEEGGRPPTATTYAVGEEGGPRPPSHPTTKAIGEEGAGRPRPTTFAAGEEGGNRPPSRPPMTTKKIGEEGGRTR